MKSHSYHLHINATDNLLSSPIERERIPETVGGSCYAVAVFEVDPV